MRSRLFGLSSLRVLVALVMLAGVLFVSRPVSAGHVTQTELISVHGDPAGVSGAPAVSGDGTKVAYSSGASDLVVGDTNGLSDVFLYDTLTGTTTLVSVDSEGGPANGNSYGAPAVSGDGTKVAYSSYASDLVVGDINGARDVFLYDTLTGTTTLVSVDSEGGPANGNSYAASVSGDGTKVAYSSYASDLVVGDINGARDVFLYDTMTGTTTLVSVDSEGGPANGNSYGASVSGDGTKVAYHSGASDLVAVDTSTWSNVFLFDTSTGTTTMVSVDSDGGHGNGWSYYPSVSGDGTKVAYYSDSSDLVVGDTNGLLDVFLYDTVTGTTTLVSVDSDGGPANRGSDFPSVSGDGTKVAYRSYASDLVVGDTNGLLDVFVYDTVTGTTTLVSVDSDGGPANSNSFQPSVSGDGTKVAYSSGASDLVVGDTNGLLDVFLGSITYANTFDDDDGSVFEADIEWLAAAGITKGCDPPLNALFCPDDFVTRGQMAAFLTRALNLPAVSTDFFADDAGSIFGADINRLAAAGITKGCDTDAFCPNRNVTRGETAAFLVRALDYTDDGGGNLFTDDDTSVFEADIDRLGTAGLTKGCNPPTNDRFCPNDFVTRGQMAAFLHRALG